MTSIIPPPRRLLSEADVQIECESAIDRPVREMIELIIQAGWPPRVVFAALKGVVQNQELAYAEDPDPADDPVVALPMRFPLAPF